MSLWFRLRYALAAVLFDLAARLPAHPPEESPR